MKKRKKQKKEPFPVKAVAIARGSAGRVCSSGIGYYVYQAQQYNHVFFPIT